jgi:hypothetical protein
MLHALTPLDVKEVCDIQWVYLGRVIRRIFILDHISHLHAAISFGNTMFYDYSYK